MIISFWTLLLLSCKDDTGDDGLDPATVPLDGPCDLARDWGGFTVSGTPDGGGVQGSVADGVVPVLVLEEILSEGGCSLLRRNNPVCTPACNPGQTCDFDGNCIPYPAAQDLGTVEVDGLARPVEMEPVFPGNTYYDWSLPDPPFDPAALVTLDMPAGVYGPADLHGVGFEPLDVLDAQWVVGGGAALAVHWTPPSVEPVRSEVAIGISIDLHGVTPGTLRCALPDTGEGEVPASIIAALIDAGVTGFPSGYIERRTVDRHDMAEGCFDLTLSSTRTVPVDVVGFTPCTDDEECPEGQECNEEMQICE